MQLNRNKEMKFETLKKSYKKQIIIGAVAICIIGGALTFSLTRAKYEIANDLELAKGTINYKAYDFKIMAMYKSDDKTNYIEIEEMPSEGYTINESKSYCNMSDGNQNTNAILKTIDGNHIISKLKKNDRCFIYFDKANSITISDIIAANNPKTATPDFSQTAETDEGVYATNDGMYGGISYYWRGAATTNHLVFADKCWRIVRINGDESIRLIYNGIVKSGNTCIGNGVNSEAVIMGSSDSEKYYATSDGKYEKSYYVGWTYVEGKQRPIEGDTPINSNAKIKTEEWYNNNIGNNTTYDSKVANGKFCNDRNVGTGGDTTSWGATGASFYYKGYNRVESKNPILECQENDIYILKAGAITADEVVYAGYNGKNNYSYYMFVNSSYWTMSPCQWNSNRGAFVYLVHTNGYLNNGTGVQNTTIGLRPVINLKSDVIFSSGDGTIDNPYIVAD